VAVASPGPYAPDRQPCQHPTTQFFTCRMPFLPPNQQCQSTEGSNCVLLHSFTEFSCLMRLLDRTRVWRGCCTRASCSRRRTSITLTARSLTTTSRRRYRSCGVRSTRSRRRHSGSRSAGSTRLQTASFIEQYVRRSNVTESMVTMRSPFCGYNTA